MLNYQLITPPVAEPVTVAQAKAQCRVDFSNDDALIALYITAAREYVEQRCQRAIYNQQYALTLDQFNYGDFRSTVSLAARNPLQFSGLWDAMTLRLPMPRLVSVDAITYADANGNPATLDTSGYVVDTGSQPGRVWPNSGLQWPTTDFYLPGSVKVLFTAGSYGDGVTTDTCPQAIRLAILLLVAHYYGNREATQQQVMTTIPLGVDSLLQPYKFVGYL